MNRSDFQELPELRITEAQALMRMSPQFPDAAYYLAGYSVECALKACIAKLFSQYDFPDKKFVNDCHTHNLQTLIEKSDLERDRIADAGKNIAFGRNWTVVKDWSESSRYARHTVLQATTLIEAISDAANGVLPWIKARW